MARAKFLAVNGSTALSISPSRTCRCQSSGLRMVIRVVMTLKLPDRRGCRRKGLHRRLVDHGAGEIGDTGKAALGAPVRKSVDDRDHAARIAEGEIADHHRA